MNNNFLSLSESRKLSQLISNVLNCLEIHLSPTAEIDHVITIDTYRNILHQRWSSVNDNVSRCKFKIKNVDTEIEITDFITDKLSEYLYEGLIQTACFAIYGGIYPGNEIKFFIDQIIRVAIGHSVETVVSQFNMIGSNDSIPFQYIEAFEGIKIESDIEIEKGIKIIPLPANFSEMPNYLQNDPMLYFRRSHYFENKTLIVVNGSVSPAIQKPIVSDSNSNRSKDIVDFRSKFQIALNYNTFPNFYSENYEGYYNLPLAMSLVCNTHIKTCASAKIFPEDNIFNLSLQSLGGTCFYSGIDSFLNTTEVNFQKDQVEEFKNIFDKLNTFKKSESERLNIAINRWMKSKGNQNMVDKMIDLGISFECIVGSDKFQPELSFRLRLYLSRFLGSDKPERKELIKTLNKMYGWRSACVHTGKLPKMKTGDDPGNIVKEFQDLCRKCIMKVLDNGKFPEWDDIIHD